MANVRRKLKILGKISRVEYFDPNFDRSDPSLLDVDFNFSTDPQFKEFIMDGDILITEREIDDWINRRLRQPQKNVIPVTHVSSKVLFGKKHSAALSCSADLGKNHHWKSPIHYTFHSSIENSTITPRIIFINTTDGVCYSYFGYRNDKTINGAQPIILGGKHCDDEFGRISQEILYTLGIFPIHRHFNQDFNFSVDANFGINGCFDLNRSNKSYADPLYQYTMSNALDPTFIDIYVLNEQYGGISNIAIAECDNGGYPNPNGCEKCICPPGWKGKTCKSQDTGTENIGNKIYVNFNDDGYECKTLHVSIGSDDNITKNHFKTAWFHFESNDGEIIQIVFFEVTDGVNNKNEGCTDYGVELKYRDFSDSGYIFCGNDSNFVTQQMYNLKDFGPHGNLAMVRLYSRGKKLNVTIKYRSIDSRFPSSPPPFVSSCDPPFDCRDFHDYCVFFDNNGMCSMGEWYELTECAASCNIKNCKCRNLRNDCASLSTKGECTTNSAMMHKECRWSCGLCGKNHCEDALDCKNYPAKFCQTNATMAVNCPKTCKRCGI